MAITTVKSKQQFTVNSDVSLNSAYKITNSLDPTNPQDLATKAYVDAVKTGLDIKQSVRVATTGNLAHTYTATAGTSGRGQITGATNVLDGVSLSTGDRILVKDQLQGAQNGIWVVSTLGTGSNGIWDRAIDFDQDAEVTAGAFTFVEDGSNNADSGWVLTTNNPITVGGASGTALAWAQFSGAGQITAGDGLYKSGNTMHVGTASTARIVVNADNIDLATVSIGSTVGTQIRKFEVDTYGRISNAVNASFSDIQTTIGSQNSNSFLAAPSGSSGNPTFRTITAADLTASGTAAAVVSITGTSNQVIVSTNTSTGIVTLSTPQNIHTTATPTFAGLTLTGGAVTTSTPYLSKTQTWNAGAVVFTGETVNITDTASAAGSKFVEYQVGGSAKWAVRKDGAVVTGIWNASTIGVQYGGTGATTLTGVVIGNGTAAMTAVASTTALQVLRVNATGNGYEFATVSFGGGSVTTVSVNSVNGFAGTVDTSSTTPAINITTTQTGVLIGNGTAIAGITGTANQLLRRNATGTAFEFYTPAFLSATSHVVRELKSYQSNGVYTLTNSPTIGTEHVFVNGVLQNVGVGNDYTISGSIITFEAGAVPAASDVVLVSYLK